jgi:AcrR family transcriptional regulator
MRQRARNDEDKEKRRRAILDAALAVWRENSYNELTMDAVAERTGLVKGTLYRYFPAKEELLLDLAEELIEEWLDEVDSRLDAKKRVLSPEHGAAILGRSLQGREPLTRLLALVGGILEHNVGEARARRFKEMLRRRAEGTASRLARLLPFLGEPAALRLVVQIYALLAGLGEMAYPSPVVQRVIQEPGFEMFRIDIVREIAAATGALLRGLETRPRRRR